MAFVERNIDVTFTLSDRNARPSTFADSGGLGNTVRLTGLRTTAQIVKAGTVVMTAHLRIYGVPRGVMNRLATMGYKINSQQQDRDVCTIAAGEVGSTPGIVFVGTVLFAWIDFQGSPEVALDVTLQAGAAEDTLPATPTSYQGPADVVTIMTDFAARMKKPFVNHGVTGRVLSNPYFPGTLGEQAKKCANDNGFEMTYDTGPLEIWPKNGARGELVPIVAPDGGMILYPTYNGSGIMVRTAFNPSIVFGGKVKVESSLPAANGVWQVRDLEHNLESQTPGGQWSSSFMAVAPDNTTPTITPG